MLDSVRILVADAHYLAREGLKAVLGPYPEFRVVGEAQKPEELTAIVPKMEPDLLVVDLGSQSVFAQRDIAEAVRLWPPMHMLALIDDPQRADVYEGLRQGVKSFLLYACDRDEIVSALRTTAKGDKFFCTQVLDTLLDPSHPEGEAAEPTVVSTDSLTQREGEILTLIGQGHSTQQISQLLMLSRHTVQTHRKNIMRKLGLQTTARLIRFAVTFGRGKS